LICQFDDPEIVKGKNGGQQKNVKRENAKQVRKVEFAERDRKPKAQQANGYKRELESTRLGLHRSQQLPGFRQTI
jgi:hypothetical protein